METASDGNAFIGSIAIALAAGFVSCQHVTLAASARPPPTGIELFTRHNRFVDAKISPGGTYLAAISVEGGTRTLAVVDFKSRKPIWTLKPIDLGSRRVGWDQSVGEFIWVNDRRLVMELWEQYGTLAAPVDQGEIYSVNADGTNARAYHGRLVGRLPKDDRQVLIEGAQFRMREDPTLTLFKMDVYDGTLDRITASPIPGETSFLLDETGEPRIAGGIDRNVKPKYFYRDARSWSALTTLKGMTEQSIPVGFVAQTRTMYVVEPLIKGFGIYALNLETGEHALLSHNDWVPPRGYLLDGKTRQIVAVEYEPDVPVWDFLVPDHPMARVLKGLLAAYPDENVRILSATDDQKKVVVLVYSDRDPGRFFLLDVDRMSAEEIVSARPWIKPEEMSEVTAFHFPASDGNWIHGYVTMPKGGQGLPPMVVIPHGGPHFVRDSWGFDPEVQLLASQGFAVLQVNYRGSGGYGLRYQESGYTHWGDRMMEDVIDATRYAVRKGYADPKRICLYGGSFGGYAALQTSILAPDLFRCAAGYAGIYDLTLLSHGDDIARSWLGRAFVRTVVGTDEAALKAASPVYNVEKIQARVLLVHGKKDPRAPIARAEQLQQALAARGAAPEWLVEPKEGHGFYDEDARERMYSRLLDFLRRNTAPVP